MNTNRNQNCKRTGRDVSSESGFYKMSKYASPTSPPSLQPGRHLSVDSRPTTACTLSRDEEQTLSKEIFLHWNSLHLREASVYVRSPFKQGRQKHYQESKTFYDVSSPMRQKITHSLSMHKLNTLAHPVSDHQMVQKSKSFCSRKNQGRLMPLLGIPIVKGPAMKECIGITSGNRKLSRANEKGRNHFRRNFHQDSLGFRLPQQASVLRRSSFTSLHSNDKCIGDSEAICSDLNRRNTFSVDIHSSNKQVTRISSL